VIIFGCKEESCHQKFAHDVKVHIGRKLKLRIVVDFLKGKIGNKRDSLKLFWINIDKVWNLINYIS